MSTRRQPRKGRSKPPVKLRVIGGELRGRTIQYHGADFTRPMKDNVRENLFNILGHAVKGSICFDLFAGTGALSFESLSRGAQSVVAVEQNAMAARCIEATGESLGVEKRLKVIRDDAFRLAGQLLASPPSDSPWIVFLSPPYAFWTDRQNDLNRVIHLAFAYAPPGSVVVAETNRQFDPDRLMSADWDVRNYGDTRLAIARPIISCQAYLGEDLSL